MENQTTLKCLIVEDESLAQRIIEKYVEDLPALEIVGKCKNAMEAIQMLNTQHIDLMFLDINMPRMSGISFLKTLKNPPLVIMTTAYREYALESYEMDVIDYLHKPFSFERFFMAVNKAQSRLQTKQAPATDFIIKDSYREQIDEAFIFVKSDKVTFKVNFKDILFIESVGDYIKIFTPERVIITYQSLKHLENILPARHFPRVHKSFLISISKINTIQGNQIKIADHDIPIGRSYRQVFFDLVQSFSGNE